MTQETMLDKIFLASRNTIARVVSRIVPPKEIEDIVQETYVRICQIENSENIHSPRSFMLKTARNLALDHLKKADTRYLQEIEDETDYHSLDDTLSDQMFENAANNQAFSDFCEAVRELPAQCRKVFVLKKVYGYSQKEIAETCGLSESTVEKHIAAGLKKCTLFMRERQHIHSAPTKANQRHGGSNE
ncbi:RNA polymerase sigma factor [Catenovulum sp. 2E275]|uniref:RNA polymerase sigma factor n=1 Tax=Catenovulum sp. 2E275 TaxID=2980497 RepID=UPI0021D2E47A|nr:RNA polymerase sigma factor [Catenovulum sp. 2E275]MCU4677259.1 RNA polymerase sigma factor [Catenovulum sp. 2E275]